MSISSYAHNYPQKFQKIIFVELVKKELRKNYTHIVECQTKEINMRKTCG